MTDPIADMLNRIKNSQAVSKETAEFPFSNIKYSIAKILEAEGFLGKVEVKGKKVKKNIEVVLKYNEKIPAISGLRKISKLGQRIYVDSRKINKVKGGFGIMILSTSKGLMTGKEARKQKTGGEIICEVW